VYRIPIRGDKIGDIISIRRCNDWLEIVIGGERKFTEKRNLEISKLI
jgi:hypothetical protein